MKILYLHGIGSGVDSRTPRELKRLLPEAEIINPEIPARPREAVEFIKKNYLDEKFDLVIGTSLGGFYAQTMWLHKRLLVNPAMFADEDITTAVGYGTHEFFCARSDGATHYTVDDEYVAELREIRQQIYKNKDMRNPDKLDVNELNSTYALFGDKDDTVSHYDDFCKWYLPNHAYRFEGGHRLETSDIEQVLVPLVKKIIAEPDSGMSFILDDFD